MRALDFETRESWASGMRGDRAPSGRGGDLTQGPCSSLQRAIAASKKNDRLDARKIADLVGCDLLPARSMAPREVRDLRGELRRRSFLVSVATRLKHKSAGLLMECGVEYSKQRLHRRKYFGWLVGNLADVPVSLERMLRFDQATLAVARKLVACLLFVDKGGRPFTAREESAAKKGAATRETKQTPAPNASRPTPKKTTSRANRSSDR